MKGSFLVCSFFFIFYFWGTVLCQKYEHKHSFREPFLLGHGNTLPFWEFGGSTLITEDAIHLTSALPSSAGWLWNDRPVEMSNWEINFEFKIGGGGNQGADGIALWYAEEPKIEGIVLGSKDNWKGFALIFDTFDNDGQNEGHATISLLLNDGTQSYNSETNGRSLQVASCKFNLREMLTRVKVIYTNQKLSVYASNAANNKEAMEECFTYSLELKQGYYFGLSAATGFLKDNHDVFSFIVYNLDPAPPSNNDDSLDFDPEDSEHQAIPREKNEDMLTRLETLKKTPEKKSKETSSTPSRPLPSSNPPTITPAPSPTNIKDDNSDMNTMIVDTLKTFQTRVDALTEQQAAISNVLGQVRQDIWAITQHSSTNKGSDFQQGAFNEAMDKLLGIVSDTKSLIETDILSLRNAIADMRVEMVNDKSERETNKELLQYVSDINRKVSRVQNTLEWAKREQDTLASDLKLNKEEIASSIQKSTSFGFWTYFLLFQTCFGVFFVWWKKMRDDANKKFL